MAADAAGAPARVRVEHPGIAGREGEVEQHPAAVDAGVLTAAVQHSAVEYGRVALRQPRLHRGRGRDELGLLARACVEEVVRGPAVRARQEGGVAHVRFHVLQCHEEGVQRRYLLQIRCVAVHALRRTPCEGRLG